MSKKYKKMGVNQKPKTMPVVRPCGIETFLKESKLTQGYVTRISKERFIQNLENAVASWSHAFVEANYKPDQTLLSGEVFAAVSQYPGDQYSTLKIYTGRPDGWSEHDSNLSAYTVLDINVVAFKFDEALKVRGDAVALDHQKPQPPYNPDCRSPEISSNNILSGLAYDTLAQISSMAPLSAFVEFDKYIDSRLESMSEEFHIVDNKETEN